MNLYSKYKTEKRKRLNKDFYLEKAKLVIKVVNKKKSTQGRPGKFNISKW